jgi:hypothetical protein
MGNTYCIPSRIQVSLNGHNLGTYVDVDTTLALEGGSNNKYATHVACNHKIEKLKINMKGLEYDDLCIKLKYTLPVDFTPSVTDINCVNGSSTVLISRKKDKTCADVVLSSRSSTYDITSREIVIVYRGKLDRDIKLNECKMHIASVAQYITTYV